MRRVTLSGNKMKNKKELHAYIARKLDFPSYYGKNLDALYDCLTDISEPLLLSVTYTERLIDANGEYGNAFLQTLKDAAEENKSISLMLYSERKPLFRREEASE